MMKNRILLLPPSIRIFLLGFLMICIGSRVRAQDFEVGGGVAATFYMGDIDVYYGNVFPQMRGAAVLTGIYQWREQIGFRANLTVGQLFADERRYPSSDYRRWRGYAFKTNFAELAGMGEWSPNFARWRNFSGYGVGGLAVTYVDPTPDFSSNPELDGVKADLEKTGSHMTVAIPVGAGVKYTFGNNWAIRGEMMGRKTFSDYIDGISQVASPRSKDFYYTGNIILTKTFGTTSRRNLLSSQKRGGCPTF